MELRKAERKRAKIKLALQGPSGSGKTYSALQLAFGIVGSWDKIALIDTENGSADLYSHLGDYRVLPLSKPFSPERFIKAIDLCEQNGAELIIIDSLSAEWDGEGGILDTHGKMVGNSFANWSKVLPSHHQLIQRILGVNAHVIASFRSKQDYVISEKNGKMVPEKVGLKAIARDGTDYEFSIVFEIDVNHNATTSKDRTGLFVDQLPTKISSKTGVRIKRWCEIEISDHDLLLKLQGATTDNELKALYNQYQQFQGKLLPQFRERWKQITTSTISSNGTA